MTNILSNDLDRILRDVGALWENLRNQRIFITGGTGFFGSWLLESFVWANKKLNLNSRATVLTRDSKQFAKKCPHLYHDKAMEFYQGDVQNFIFPHGKFSYIIHAASSSNAFLNASKPDSLWDTIVTGTRHTLEFAKHCEAKCFLLTSSGAVYGGQSTELTFFSEDYFPKFYPTTPDATYANGKCLAEHISCLFGKENNLDVKIARCFAFVGPYLPLDLNFAIGNFLNNALQGQDILINGDGTPLRSYLYASELTTWLWVILFCGDVFKPYNVGSDKPYSIREVAEAVANQFYPSPRINILKKPVPNQPVQCYLPDIALIKKDLDLSPQINLEQAIQLTKAWHQQTTLIGATL